MVFLQSVTRHADKLKHTGESKVCFLDQIIARILEEPYANGILLFDSTIACEQGRWSIVEGQL